MPFTSVEFLFLFLPITLGLYIIIPSRIKNLYLFAASIIFYSWGNLEFLPILFGLLIYNWVYSQILFNLKNDNLRKLTLTLGILVNVGTLIWYKFHILPLGMSFFTFHSLSYLIDIYLRQSRPASFIGTGIYQLLFANVSAGPINLYQNFSPQLTKTTIGSTNHGVARFITGLAQKVLLADSFAQLSNNLFSNSSQGFLVAWLGIFYFALQLYFDFAGYSHMAIGLGQILGFEFCENFNYPYRAHSITDFWQRWHISLTSWLRQYIYFPLGGNRKGKFRTYLNIMLVFLVSGFWHGTGWTFIFWGMWHGLFMIVEKLVKDSHMRIPHLFSKLGNIYTWIIIGIGWVLFRSPDMHSAYNYINQMFTNPSFDYRSLPYSVMSPYYLILTLIGVLSAYGSFAKLKLNIRIINLGWYSLLLFLCILAVAGNTYIPFIYTKF